MSVSNFNESCLSEGSLIPQLLYMAKKELENLASGRGYARNAESVIVLMSET